VIVPARFRDDFHLRLNLSLRFEPPDLAVGAWGVRQTLSFGGVRFSVAVPWSAIFAISGAERSEQAFMYAEEMPRELFEEAARHFGLSGNEVDQLREEAKGIDRAGQVPSPGPTDPAARRRALQVVQAVSGEFELPEEAGNEPEPPAEASAEAAPVPADAPEEARAAPVPVLKPVAAHQEPEPAEAEPEPEPPAGDDKGKRRGHLRLVK
jgi:stringent starvation protein B